MSKEFQAKKRRSKIVLVCGNAHRELSMLQLLKKEFEKSLNADVWIIGSLADIQKTYFSINRIKPDVVFISQIVEKVTRDLANYVRKSGAILCVLPVELYYLKNEYHRLFKKQSYNEFVDYYFLPGMKMYKDFFKYSDIERSKLFVTGSPKIDLYINGDASKSLSRFQFCQKFKLEREHKNIFIFSSFIVTSLNYARKEKAFKGDINYINRRNKEMLEMRNVFLRDIKRLCSDFPTCNVILKLHPLEEDFTYKKINSKNFFVVKDVRFNDTVDSIDIAIYWRSTIATECWIKGIKTLQYVPVKKQETLGDFNGQNPVYYNYPSLKNGVIKFLDGKLDEKFLTAQKNFLSLWYYKIDGKAVSRISSLLKKILQKNNLKITHYAYINSQFMFLFSLAEKIIGIKLSRRLVSVLFKDYAWRYAANNYVLDPPSRKK